MKTTLKILATSTLMMTCATVATAQTVGETVLGVEVNVAKVVTEGYSANALIGTDVQNDRGARVGAVHDLIIAPQGDVSLAVMEVGGFIGIDSKWIAVPADMFQPGDGGHFVLPNATEEALTNMPPFRYTH